LNFLSSSFNLLRVAVKSILVALGIVASFFCNFVTSLICLLITAIIFLMFFFDLFLDFRVCFLLISLFKVLRFLSYFLVAAFLAGLFCFLSFLVTLLISALMNLASLDLGLDPLRSDFLSAFMIFLSLAILALRTLRFALSLRTFFAFLFFFAFLSFFVKILEFSLQFIKILLGFGKLCLL